MLIGRQLGTWPAFNQLSMVSSQTQRTHRTQRNWRYDKFKANTATQLTVSRKRICEVGCEILWAYLAYIRYLHRLPAGISQMPYMSKHITATSRDVWIGHRPRLCGLLLVLRYASILICYLWLCLSPPVLNAFHRFRETEASHAFARVG